MQANDKVFIVTEDYPPYSYLDNNGEVVGLATQAVSALMAEAGLNHTIKLVPWARAYEAALKKPNTLIYPLVYLESRKDKFHFICPISHITDFYFFRLISRNDIKVTALNDVKNYVTGVVRNDSIHQFLLKAGFINDKNLDIAASDSVTLKKLQHGRVDLIYTSQATMTSRLKELGLPPESVTALFQIPQYKEQALCIGMSKQTNPALVLKLNQAHKRIIERNSAKGK